MSERSFLEIARANFDFLEIDWGFVCRRRSDRWVRYESDKVFVNICHSQMDEVGLSLGLRDSGEFSGYDLSFMLLVVCPDIGKFFKHRIASSAHEIEAAFRRMADLLRRYGHDALSGDKETFSLMAFEARRIMAQANADMIISQANAAFRKKDYARSVELYSSIEDACMSPVARKKLAYALKKIGTDG